MNTPAAPVTGDTQEVQPNEADLKAVRVSVRQLDYHTIGVNPLGQKVTVIKTAYGPGMPMIDPARQPNMDVESQEYADAVSDFQHGQLILVRPEAYIGLISTGVVRDVEYDEEGDEVPEEELLNVVTASVEELAEWIKEEHPTVNDVVSASDGDKQLAEKLLQAEALATDNEPRTGVVRGLTAVIGRAE